MFAINALGRGHRHRVLSILAQQEQIGLLPFPLFSDVPLQVAPLVELAGNQPVALRTIPQQGVPGFALVLRPDLGVAARDPFPDAREPARQPRRPRVGFRDPALFLSVIERLPFLAVPSGHFAALEFQRLRPRAGFELRLPDETLEPFRHSRGYRLPRFIDRRKLIGIAEARRNIFGPHACLTRDRIDFAAIIEGDEAAPIPSRHHEPAFLEGLREGVGRIRALPAFLEQRLDVLRIEADTPRLLPFLQRVS